MSTFRRILMLQEEKDIKPYMHIEALEDGLTVSFSNPGLYYSLDGRTWNTLPANTTSPAINTGEKIYFKGELTPIVRQGIGNFTLNKKCNAGGNAMSLLFGNNFGTQYNLSEKNSAFANLFQYCDTLISVSDNFLPATTLSSYCYQAMFYKCINLVNAPELPATTLAFACYSNMFWDCNNLNYIKMLATDISASVCLANWVMRVANTGTFVKNAAVTSLTSGTSGIPNGWTVVNDGEESGGEVKLISFTIDGAEYQAEEGMTWGEWVESEYNVNRYFEVDLDDSIMVSSLFEYVGTEEDYVYSSDVIIEGYKYLIVD